jgi:putative flippase GtrA
MENTNTTTIPVADEENKIKKLMKQFSKFFIIGIINTIVDVGILNAETLITGAKQGYPYAIQKGISFLVAVTLSYFMNKYWTFQDKVRENEGRKFSQFLFVSIVGMAINISVATIVVTYFKAPVNGLLQMSFLTDQIWVTIGALCGSASGLIWNFVGYKFWVFKK